MKFKWRLYSFVLGIVTKSSCPDRIPRSGEKAKKVNCYSLTFDNKDGTPYLLVKGYNQGIVNGTSWDNNKYSIEQTISIQELDKNYQFRLTHFYGKVTVYYSSIYDFLFHWLSKGIYFKLSIQLFFGFITGYISTHTPMVSLQKMELLDFIIKYRLSVIREGEFYIDSRPFVINPISLMPKLYDAHWFNHPQGNKEYHKLVMYLEALVEDGALKRVKHHYTLEAKALSILERFEEEVQRHTDAMKLNKRILYLTLLIAVTGAVSAKIIIIPTMIDFSGFWEWMISVWNWFGDRIYI